VLWIASQSDQNLRGPRVSCAADVAHRPLLHGFAARRVRCPGTDRRPDDEQTDTIPFKNTYTIKKNSSKTVWTCTDCCLSKTCICNTDNKKQTRNSEICSLYVVINWRSRLDIFCNDLLKLYNQQITDVSCSCRKRRLYSGLNAVSRILRNLMSIFSDMTCIDLWMWAMCPSWTFFWPLPLWRYLKRKVRK